MYDRPSVCVSMCACAHVVCVLFYGAACHAQLTGRHGQDMRSVDNNSFGTCNLGVKRGRGGERAVTGTHMVLCNRQRGAVCDRHLKAQLTSAWVAILSSSALSSCPRQDLS